MKKLLVTLHESMFEFPYIEVPVCVLLGTKNVLVKFEEITNIMICQEVKKIASKGSEEDAGVSLKMTHSLYESFMSSKVFPEYL